MGVDTKIYLPPDVRIEDAADVIGILVGVVPQKRRARDWNYDFEYITVPGVKIQSTSVPSLNWIIVRAPKGQALINGEGSMSLYYDSEAGEQAGKYGRRISARSTPLVIALGIKLAKFFGGKIIYRDSASKSKAYGTWANRYFPKPRRNNCPSGGGLYDKFQNDKYNVKPLTRADIERARRVASYTDADRT